MWIPFEELSSQSRVWIYQAERRLTASEQEMIEVNMREFCSQWKAHGTPLRSSFKIDHDQFLILSVDEAWSGASGCSIDGSVKIVKEIGSELEVDFFNRMDAAFLVNEAVSTVSLKDLKHALSKGIITASTPAFNTLVAAKGDLDQAWILPLEKMWLAKYLPKQALV